MIKKYNQYIKESLLSKLEGPNEEEVWEKLKDQNPIKSIRECIEMGYFEGVKRLFDIANEKNIKINQYRLDEFLNDAVEKNSYEIVEFLLEKGANPLNKSFFDSPLDVARFYENDKMFNLLNKYTNKIKKDDKKI